jgi:hypothetical protein
LKKLSVILLALAMTLSLAVVASAANFEPYLGGEFQLNYWGDDAHKYNRLDLEGSWGTYARFKLMLTGTVEDEETGTWAKIGTKLSTWNVSNGNSTDDHHYVPIYEAGIKGIGGVLDIWYTNDEYANAKRGQIPLWTPMAKFGGDPIFDKAPGNIIAADYNSGNVTFNFGIDLNKGSKDNSNLIITASTFKFDDGQVHSAFQSDTGKDTIMLVGGQYALGFGTIAADFRLDSFDDKDADDKSVFQAAISLDDLGLKATLVADQKYLFPKDGGFGVGLEYTGFENFVIGAKMLQASDDADKNNDNAITDFFVGYNYGVFETRIGSAKIGKDGKSVFYAAAHVGMW